MAGVEQPRLKMLYLLRLLKEESDEEKGVSMSRILRYLANNGIVAERKSIYRDIETLQKFGYEIEKNSSRPVEYCLVHRTFAIAELKFLVDAVQSAQFISSEMTDKLIRKLESQTNRRRASELRRQVHYAGRVKSQNDHIYYTTGTLHDAINNSARVSFRYVDFAIDKSTQSRRNGELYELSPYALAWNDDKYYVIGFHERRGCICNFRVDRMKSVTMLSEKARVAPLDFDVDKYISKIFSMFSGENVLLDIRFHNSLINPVMDRFGLNTPIFPDGETHFIAHVQAAVSPVFFSWLFQFGTNAKILKPSRIADAYQKQLESGLEEIKR